MRVVMWGTYDLGKPRNRIALRGLRENGVEVIECHREIWSDVEDKSQVSGAMRRAKFLLRWLAAYPGLLVRYWRLPPHDVVLIGYLGQLDVLVLWPLAKLRGVPLVWDVFLSLYNTIVEDRRLARPGSLLARAIHAWEWLAARAADRVILDTRAHADYFADLCSIPRERAEVVFVGVEEEVFPAREEAPTIDSTPSIPTVLFFGQLSPLHGIEAIIEAARLARDEEIRWLFVGVGQEEEKIRQMLHVDPLDKVEWRPWIPYAELIEVIHASDVCLGIFGDSDKAGRVIPNKVFQVLCAGVPLVTRDSPAIRELLDPVTPGVALVPANDGPALLGAVHELLRSRSANTAPLHREIAQRIATARIGADWRRVLDLAGSPEQ